MSGTSLAAPDVYAVRSPPAARHGRAARGRVAPARRGARLRGQRGAPARSSSRSASDAAVVKTWSSTPGVERTEAGGLRAVRCTGLGAAPGVRGARRVPRVHVRALPSLRARLPGPAARVRGPAPARRPGVLRLRARQRGELLRPHAARPRRRRLRPGDGPHAVPPDLPRRRVCHGHAPAVDAGSGAGRYRASTSAGSRRSTGNASAGCASTPARSRRRGSRTGSFAVVHFSHLIEHVDDPRAFLREVRRVLRDDGRAVITTPNIGGFQARLFGATVAVGDRGPPRALRAARTLRRMLAEEGFAIEREVTWGGLAAGTAPVWLKRPAGPSGEALGFRRRDAVPGEETMIR